jgi:PEGA domain.
MKATNTAGMSEMKEQLRNSLIAKTFNIANRTMVYAKIMEKPVLANDVKITESQLRISKDGMLIDKANLIYTRANANLEQLKDYGITAETLKELKDIITQFDTVIPTIRIERNEAKMATSQLNALFTTNDEILQKIDLLIEIVRQSNPDIYVAYKANRKITNRKSATLSLTTKVISAADGEPVKGAKAILTPATKMGVATAAKSAKPVEKKTAEKGMFKVKNLTEGIYSITIEKTGYATVTQTVSITDGKMTTLDVKMDKN